MQNIMNEYTKIIKFNMNQYMKLILQNKYNKYISNEFINTYIENRYCSLINLKKGITIKNKVWSELKNKKEELLLKSVQLEKNIELTYSFFDLCINLNEIHKEELKETINQIIELLRKYNIEVPFNFAEECTKLFNEGENSKKELLKTAETNKFFMKYKTIKSPNLKKARLKYNIKFPIIYNRDIIQRTFDKGIIAEDKLFVEYNLITTKIIKDLQDGIYRKQYIIEFCEDLFEKHQKRSRLLEIINHYAIQDRAIINIYYKNFEKNKNVIYEMIKKGFKIALTLDDSFKINEGNIQRLTLFEYVLLPKDLEKHNEIMKHTIKNIIELK